MSPSPSAPSNSNPGVAAAGRYAPSPSGPLHLGNLRTALVAWLAARSRGAPFVLRIEDLDRERSRAEHERSQLADLAALGLDWDGPVMCQSERVAEHREAFEWLRDAGRVYPCWCTRADVREAASAPHPALGRGRYQAASASRPASGSDRDRSASALHRAQGRDRDHAESASRFASTPSRYPGTCRDLSGYERRRRAEETGREPAWRLDARAERVCFEDLLHGRCDGVVDDVVLWRADDAPAYNLAVVVDDDAQSVGEVVRGDDLIDSTFAQIVLSRILGLTVPAYLHVPLVLGAKRRRLAKRDGAVTLQQHLDAGETIPQILAWMARSAGLLDTGEPVALDALISTFEPKRLTREPVVLPPAGSLARRVAPGAEPWS